MTMLLPPFELHFPQSLDELLECTQKFGPDNFDYLAGGSDLLCNYKWKLNPKPHVISLQKLETIKTIEPGRIGANVLLREIQESSWLQKEYPILPEVAKKVASKLIQEQATLGGNLMLDTRCHFFNQSYLWRKSLGYCLKADGELCHVVPKVKRDGKLVENRDECFATNSSDLLPILISLGARIELLSHQGKREVPLKDFYSHDGIRRFDKRPGELLVALLLPEKSNGLQAGYKKLRPRESWDFPVLGVAAALRQNSEGLLENFSLCINAVDTHPLDFSEFGASYLGQKLGEHEIEAIAEEAYKKCQPKLNVPMEPGYRKKMVRVFTRRLLQELCN